MKLLFIISCLIAATNTAAAHGTPSDALETISTWTYDPWVIIPLYVSGILYLIGTTRLWGHAGHGKGVRQWQVLRFWSGWTLLALALVSPLHWLGERLFVAHMVEHEVLMVLAAPLLAFARPAGAFLWALPRGWRIRVGRAVRWRAVAGFWMVARDPLSATVLHAIALWAWHMPALYQSVLVNTFMHRLQHACFFFSAVLFWWALTNGPGRVRGYGIALACLFFTTLQTGLLGILLALSRHLWYPQQGDYAAIWGLSWLEDQQLAGLVMWVPPSLVYLIVGLYCAARWISGSPRHWNGARHALPAH